ncbi:hypothetical protein ACFLQ7_00020 [Actinomycetota bacterium]
MRTQAPILAAAIVLAACTASGPDVESTTTEGLADVTTTTTVPTADRFVTTTPGGTVVVHPGAGEEPITIDQPAGTVSRQPVWLADGSVLFATVDASGASRLVAVDADTGAMKWDTELSSRPFYYLPSPLGATAVSTSLRNDPGGAGLIAELVGPDGSVEPLSTSSPFYATWAPDGSQLATHVEQSRLSVRDATGTRVVSEPTGTFQAPAWVADGLVTLRTAASGQVLSVWNDESFRDVASVDGSVRFVVGGGKAAIQSVPTDDDSGGVQAALPAQELPVIPPGRLSVVDLASGSIEQITDVLTPLFQWDPTGSRLLYATFDTGTTLDFTWHLWSGGQVEDFSSFLAQPQWFRDVVPFFDQYDQSVSLWSDSGASFAYPAVVDGAPVVVVQPTSGEPPIIVENATWVAWDRRSR